MIKKLLFVPFLFILCSGALAQEGIGSLISPGELASAHARYDGIKSCTECHALGGGVPDSKCLDCHKKLAERIDSKRGSHAGYTGACIKCHNDHKGRGYKMIVLEKNIFNHDVTGYPLKDKHNAACIKCHKKEGKYSGLSRECTTCHKDPHKGQLGKECEKCHNTKDWKEIEKFDHDRDSKYPLTGKHIDVKCVKCHENNRFKIEKNEECITCHKDPHKGKPLCRDCHTTESWKKVKIDHDKTKYPLTDKHVQVLCGKCHKNNQLKGIPFATCDSSACHIDPHKQQFKERKCDSCHNIRGWKPSLFGHDSPEYKGYKLEGKHVETKCEKCHVQGRYKPLSYKSCETADCHRDIHKGQFKGKSCESCHNVNGWRPSLFKHEAPEYKGYKLEGKHVETKCEKCHTQGRFKPLNSKNCETSDCHKDYHKGQFPGKACESCHTVNGWKPSLFKHEAPDYKGYKLDGKHLNVKCEKCHPDGRYKPLSTKCIDCHKKDDIHKGELGNICEKCHDTKEWKKYNLNHNTQTKFPLVGKHVDTKCEKCHKDKKYKTSAEKCKDCHEDIHKGKFKEECTSCHTQSDWLPRRFDHKKEGGMELKGVHNDILCITCHKTKGEYKKVSRLCNQCHVDPHLNQFGPLACSDCHGENSWTPFRFDHGRTGYPLIGRHRGTECGDCHKNRIYRSTVTRCVGCHTRPASHLTRGFSEDCTSCHKSTFNSWAFTHPAVASGCSSCHINNSTPVRPASHTVNNYGTTCDNCHISTVTWSAHRHTSATSGCSSCHLTYSTPPRPASHTGNPAKYPATCETCHNSTASWSLHVHPTATTGCSTCHLPQRPASHANDPARYSTTCETCHNSKITWTSHVHPTAASGCSACHVNNSNPARPISHTTNNYGTTCENCHTSTVTWSAHKHAAVSSGCSTCHLTYSTPPKPASHTGNQAKYPTTCETCHNSTTAWTSHVHPTATVGCSTCHLSQRPATHTLNPVKFPSTCENCHNSKTTWASHIHPSATSGCSTCHLPQKPASHVTNGYGNSCETCHKSTTAWAFAHTGVASGCSACHLTYSTPPRPATHNTYSNRFGTLCENCHKYPAWLPATFNHTFTPFPTSHKGYSACSDCHPGKNYGNKGGCIECHTAQSRKVHESATNAGCIVSGCHANGKVPQLAPRLRR